MHTVVVVIAVVGIIGFVIGRQLLGEPIRGKRLVVLPLIVAVVGAIDLAKTTTADIHGADVVLIAVSVLIAAAIGAAQGALMRLENRDGGLWGQMPLKSLWLWGALVAGRGLVEVAAHLTGAHVAASTASILLVLGINRVAQAATIAPRAMRAGIPFAPEKDGSTFLSGLAGERTTRTTAQQFAASVGDALGDRRAQRRQRRGR